MRTLLGHLLKKKALKIRLEGPIDHKKQQSILRAISKARKEAQAVLMIINSYGGSLAIAKNIAQTLQGLKKEKIPVYCFAQQYCLNSANLILASGQSCFANKLSVIGDIGYAQQRYSFSQNVGWESFTSGYRPLQHFGESYYLHQPKDILKVIQANTQQLRRYIVENRGGKLKAQQKLLQGGTICPKAAVNIGLIDGLQSCEAFARTCLVGWRVLEGGEENRYRAINFLRNSLQIFKQQ